MRLMSSISKTTTASLNLMKKIPQDLIQFVLRMGLAGIFWMSARTKVTGFMSISDSTYFLFEEEYRLPWLSVDIAVPLATYAEHLLPILLAIGFATRLSAFGLFIMTLVIQVFVYPSAFASTHLGWFALALAVMGYGPGRWSVDHMVARKSIPHPNV